MRDRIVKLNEILSPEQCRHVDQLISSIIEGEKSKHDLREYLISQRSSLLAKEIVPEYLYYLLCYQFKLL